MAKKTQICGVIMLLIVLSASSALAASGGAITNASSSPTSSNEASDYRLLFSLYSAGSFEDALQKMQAFEEHYPQSSQMLQVLNLEGLSHLLSKRPERAIGFFKRAIQLSASNPTYQQYLYYNLAKAEFEATQYTEAEKTAGIIQLEVMDNDNRAKVRYLKARLDLRLGKPLDAARETLAAAPPAGTQLGDHETQNALAAVLDQALSGVNDLPAMEELYRSNTSSPLADTLLYHLGALEVKLGNRDGARAHLQALATHYPQSGFLQPTSDLLRSLQQAPADPTAVGVLLPVKGKFAHFGNLSLEAIEMAFDIFNVRAPDNKVTLVIEDSGDDTEQALAALDRLVNEHHVIAVIGPLLGKGIDQITQRAQILGVPLISLSRYPGTPGDFVFPAGITLKTQIQQIARYAMDKLGMKNFAMLYPKDKLGEEASQTFWDTVESQNGQIVGSESYPPDDTDFRVVVDKLSGLYYPESRQRELEDLAQARLRDQVKKRTRKTEKYFNLTPIVDYQAVFVPDEARVAGQILPTFAYRDVDHVQFLGLSAWNSPEFISRAQSYAEGTLFTDAFFSGDSSAPVRRFISQFQENFSAEPSTMEALSFDAALLVKYALQEAGAGATRDTLQSKLRGIRDFNGITGKISFKDGVFDRPLKVLTVKGGQVQLAGTGVE